MGKQNPETGTLDIDLTTVLTLLVNDTSLPERSHDHPLTGDWKDHRDCHIKPDLVLIYRLPDTESLELVRLGPIVSSACNDCGVAVEAATRVAVLAMTQGRMCELQVFPSTKLMKVTNLQRRSFEAGNVAGAGVQSCRIFPLRS